MNRDTLRQNYGIYIVAVWSIVLGAQNLINLFLISTSTGTQETTSVWVTTIYQAVSLAFSISFLVAAFGLWQLKNWGRNLFLATASSFWLVSMIGLLTPSLAGPSGQEKWLFGLRYLISTVLPLIYLNLAQVKQKFQT